MKTKNLSSITFHSANLEKIRSFYVDILTLSVNSYKEGDLGVTNEGPGHVYFNLNNALLCFEKGDHIDLGSVVIQVEDLVSALAELRAKEVYIVRSSFNYILVKDPDGRSIILEQSV
jgi:catechol 2,3-dioxygenase-like lactoylglutathione lyase family enzyme